jgi:cell wall assembly regulator SMI1
MSWKSLEAALAAVAPEHCDALAPGASPAALAKLEAAIGRKLPDAFRLAWGIHDGMRDQVFAMLEILGTREIAADWRLLRDYDGSSGGLEAEAHGPVKPLWTSPDWIPFVLIGGETRHFCLDLDPAPGGAVGQIIHATPKWQERRVVAPSIDAFLELIAAALREGRCEIDGDIDVSDALGI